MNDRFSIFYFPFVIFHLAGILFIGSPQEIANHKYQVENRKSLLPLPDRLGCATFTNLKTRLGGGYGY
jgi:hypothetical protein